MGPFDDVEGKHVQAWFSSIHPPTYTMGTGTPVTAAATPDLSSLSFKTLCS